MVAGYPVHSRESMANVTDLFLESLDRLAVEWTCTSANDLVSVLTEVIVEPVVGAPLPFEGLSLEGSGVTLDPTPSEVDAAQTGVTAVWMAVADYGTVVIQSAPDATEAASLFPALHVAVLRASDVVPDMETAFARLGPALREQPTTAILATGPSATADMGALVRGAHGPERVHVILIADR